MYIHIYASFFESSYRSGAFAFSRRSEPRAIVTIRSSGSKSSTNISQSLKSSSSLIHGPRTVVGFL